jgi:hypothetical protein
MPTATCHCRSPSTSLDESGIPHRARPKSHAPVLSSNLAHHDNVDPDGYGSVSFAHACPNAFGFGGGSSRSRVPPSVSSSPHVELLVAVAHAAAAV